MASQPGFSVNKDTIGLVMGIAGVIGVAITAYNWLLAGRAENSPVVQEMVIKNLQQDQRLDRTDEDRVNNTRAIKEQTSEIQKLNTAVTELTTVIKTTSPTRKAEVYSLPSSSDLSLGVNR